MKAKKEITVEQLSHHPFVIKALKYGMDIYQLIGPKRILTDGNNWKREPDEHEYYILDVSNRLAQLLTCCRKLSDTIFYLTSFSPTRKMKQYGITQHGHLLYTIENYVIRTQSIYDRILLLVDAVFHICNAPDTCTHEVIITNIHVKRTNVKSALKSMKKILREFQHQRNTILHHESYQEENLKLLEAYTILQQNIDKEGNHYS